MYTYKVTYDQICIYMITYVTSYGSIYEILYANYWIEINLVAFKTKKICINFITMYLVSSQANSR